MDSIKFNEEEFPFREVYSPARDEWYTVSTLDLESQLLDETGDNYVSDQAKAVDERIGYFVVDTAMELSDEDLVKYIEEFDPVE